MELRLWEKGDQEGRSLSLSCSVDDSSDEMVSRDFGRVGTAKSKRIGWVRESDL